MQEQKKSTQGKNEKRIHMLRWLYHTVLWAFLLPVILSLLGLLKGTTSFLDEIGANYLAIIISQGSSLLWIYQNFQTTKSEESQKFICTVIQDVMYAIVGVCVIFFSPISTNWFILYNSRKLVLALSSFVYVIMLILSFRYESNSYESSHTSIQ